MHRKLKVDAGAASPGLAIVDVAGEALLAAVEVDGGDPLPGFQQGDSNVQRSRGFSRTALFVAQHHDVCRAGLPLTGLHEHDSTPDISSSPALPRSSEMHGKRLEVLHLRAT